MPEPVASPPAAVGNTGLAAASVGYCGKIPARGDFVRSGLPGGFVAAWDAWFGRVLAASRDILGEDWLDAWLEAPIWHFVLAGGVCAADAAIGLWMPSVDRVGRHFPLTIAAVAPGADPGALIAECGGFLAAAAEAGLDAVTADAQPEALFTRLLDAVREPPGDPPVDPTLCLGSGALWWTAGAPRVPPGCMAAPRLPEADVFAAMLDAAAAPPR
jgi:type VI secretion system protein ImpM